jgi:hypothetical protein
MFFQTIDEATSIWIKGREFTIGSLRRPAAESKMVSTAAMWVDVEAV